MAIMSIPSKAPASPTATTKGTFWKANKQMTLFRAETNFNQESYADDWNLPSKKRMY